jgi:hypothetical protein
MKTITIALLLFGVGLFLGVNKVQASAQGDYDGIAYYTSLSSSVFISTNVPIELIDIKLGEGNDAKYVVIIDSNIGTRITSSDGSYPAPTTFPATQWATPAMIVHTSTGVSGGTAGNVVSLRGTIIRKGLSVVMDAVGANPAGVNTYWTIRYRKVE